MTEMKTLNGYEVVDAKAREDIELLKAADTTIQTDFNNHNHDNEYAPKTHNHSYNDLTDKPTIPSTAGLASEAYVDEAIAAIPKPSGMEIVQVTTNTTAEELQAILDAGKWPALGYSLFQSKQTPYFNGEKGETFYLFAGVSLIADYPSDGTLFPELHIARCYPDREPGKQWSSIATPTSPTGYRLTTYSEYFALERRVAALEGGNN